MPDQWREGIVAPIWKAGDKTDVRNYRGICLQSVAAKVTPTSSKLGFGDGRRRLYLKSNMGFLMAGDAPMLSLYCVES